MKTKLLKSGFALAALISLCIPMAAQAQIVQEVMVGQTVAPTAATVPAVKVDAGDHLFFRVLNPTGGPVAFSVPELGINHAVPGFSERTFFIDTSMLADPQIPYVVQGPGGTQLASGVIINEDALIMSQASTALATILNPTYGTAYSAPIDPEPQYMERPAAAPARQMIRGFW